MTRRKLILKSVVMIAIAFVVLSAAPTRADNISLFEKTEILVTQGYSLTSTGDYEWWYGCSPTSAGMMMAYYDRNGYAGYNFDNLVPGGTAESETYVGPPTGWSALANNVIASTGHVADWWGVDSGPTHSSDCLADFMYTSRAKADGATTFGYWVDGSPYTETDSSLGKGLYGVGQYLEYAGYDAAVLYNQLLPGTADLFINPYTGLPYPENTIGFEWDDYVAEIDAGRPVMIQVEGHSMFGFGYGDNNTVYLYDTWNPGPHTMTWGGSYHYSGDIYLTHYGVMVMTPVPVPAAVLLGILGLGVVGIKLRRYA